MGTVTGKKKFTKGMELMKIQSLETKAKRKWKLVHC